jgi:hemolysin III
MGRAVRARQEQFTMQLTKDREQTWGEELANAISHGVGFLLAIASLPILVYFAAQRSAGAR